MADFHFDHDYGQQLANPPHIQKIERALQLDPLLNYVEDLLHKNAQADKEIQSEILRPCEKDLEGNKILNGITITKAGMSLKKLISMIVYLSKDKELMLRFFIIILSILW